MTNSLQEELCSIRKQIIPNGYVNQHINRGRMLYFGKDVLGTMIEEFQLVRF